MSSPFVAAAAQAAFEQQQQEDDEHRISRTHPTEGDVAEGSTSRNLLAFTPLIQSASSRPFGDEPDDSGLEMRRVNSHTFASSGGRGAGMAANREGTSTGPPSRSLTVQSSRSQGVGVGVEVDQQRQLASRGAPRCGEELYEPGLDQALFYRSASIAALSLIGLLLNMAFIAAAVEYQVESILENGVASSSGGDLHYRGATISTSRGIEGGQILVTILSFACMVLIAESNVYEFRQQQRAELRLLVGANNPLPPLPSLFNQRILWLLIRRSALEVLIHFPHAFPYALLNDYSRYLSVAMLARLYTLLRPLGFRHPSFSRRFEIFGSKANIERFPIVVVDWRTMIKMWFLEHTGIIFIACTLGAIFLCAFGVYIAEAEVQPDSYGGYNNCLWFIFVTAATIGYGDMYPVTSLGRICAILAGMLGVILANMIAGILAVQFSKTASQNEIANFMEKSKRTAKTRKAALLAISEFWTLTYWKRKHRPGVYSLRSACQTSPIHLSKYHNMKNSIEEMKKQKKLLDQVSCEDGQQAAEMGKLLVTAADLSERVMSLQHKTDRIERLAEENQRRALSRMTEMDATQQQRVQEVETRLLETEKELQKRVDETHALCMEIMRAVRQGNESLSRHSSSLAMQASASSVRHGSPEAPPRRMSVVQSSVDAAEGSVLGASASSAQFGQQIAMMNVILRKLSKGQEDIMERLRK